MTQREEKDVKFAFIKLSEKLKGSAYEKYFNFIRNAYNSLKECEEKEYITLCYICDQLDDNREEFLKWINDYYKKYKNIEQDIMDRALEECNKEDNGPYTEPYSHVDCLSVKGKV